MTTKQSKMKKARLKTREEVFKPWTDRETILAWEQRQAGKAVSHAAVEKWLKVGVQTGSLSGLHAVNEFDYIFVVNT